jgi:hypothetical protein
MARCGFAVPLILLLVSVASAQNPPQSDPRAVALATQAMTALTNGIAVSDVTLNGNATWIAGSDNESGTATLLAKGAGESRLGISLSTGTRTEIRNDTGAYHQGESVTPDGTVRPWAEHNCQINATWFFPALSALASTSDSSLIFTYVGMEKRGNGRVWHIRVYRYSSGQRAHVISFNKTVSVENIYLDSTSLLPVAFTFNVHPDNDASTNIALEIDFSNYHTVNGVQIPMRVRRLISNGLALDIVVTSATLNSGLSDAPFAIQ